VTTVLAVDPGRDKCGLAVVTAEAIIFRAIVPTAEIGLTCRYLLSQHSGALVLLGDATGSATVAQALRRACSGVEIQLVPEANSTLRAQGRYFADNPPGLWQKLLPAGMRVPPRPVDDYAAVVLAESFFADRAVNS
jgi:RNase H-fold protein (predicted Holliday junction resolvase)